MPDILIGNVSDTAFWIAHYRALETSRPDALFQDPLAGRLAGDHGKNIAQTMPMAMVTGWTVVIRTRIIDDYLRFALSEGVDTILNLGAGLDTRPYRLEVPKDLTWIEADYAHVMEYKQSRLSGENPRCELRRLKCDLANPSERRRLFAEVGARARKIVVLTEGVVPYLSIEQAGALADDLRALDAVRYWIVDYFSPEVVKFRRGLERKMQNAPFRFRPADWFGFFGERGWRSKQIRYLAEEGDRLGRPVPLPLLPSMLMKMRALFLTQQRRAALRKSAGYVLLEPTKS